MMVGGRDIVLEGPRRGDEARRVVTGLRVLWPKLVVQRASSYELAPSADDPSVDTMTEFFVYPSEKACEMWRNWCDGPEPAPMVHVIVGESSLTYVMGGDDPHLSEWMLNVFLDVQAWRCRLEQN